MADYLRIALQIQANIAGAMPGLTLSPNLAPGAGGCISAAYTADEGDLVQEIREATGYLGVVVIFNSDATYTVTINVDKGSSTAMEILTIPPGGFVILTNPQSALFVKEATGTAIVHVFGYPL